MKEFTTAVENRVIRERTDDDYPHTFKLDGRVMHFRGPNPGEATILIAAMASHHSSWQRLSTYMDFFSRVLRPDDKDWWMARVLNPDDPLSQQAPEILAGTEGEEGVMHEIVAQWGERPTEPSGPSSSESSPPGGEFSMPNIPGSTY